MSKKFVKRLDGWGTGKKYLDEGVRPLVLLLNSKGFRTWASCEGGKGHDYPIFIKCTHPAGMETTGMGRQHQVGARDGRVLHSIQNSAFTISGH